MVRRWSSDGGYRGDVVLPELSGSSGQRAPRADLVGRVLAGRYRLMAPIGVGASARVYLADDVQLRRRVAVKVLHPALAVDPTFLRRFQAEAHAAAALNHPHVVAVYDWGRDAASGHDDGSPDAVPFLVTEYLDGGSLRGMLDSGDGSRASRLLSLSQTLLVGLQVCRGLHYAHSRGFVHRDIKPANLLFGEDRRLRIADFGLARALAEASWTEPEGVVLGTARYVSPEQAAGLPCDTRSDLYSLALVLVECVTGTVPNTADTAVATLALRAGRSIEADTDTFGPLAPLIEAAGRADPAQRADAAQFGAALMAAAERLPAPAPLPLAPPRVFAVTVDPVAQTRHLVDEAGVAADRASEPEPDTVLGLPIAGLARAASPVSAMPAAGRGAAAAVAATTTRRSVDSDEVATPYPDDPELDDPDARPGDDGDAAAGRARRRRLPRLRTMFVGLLVLTALALATVLGLGLSGVRLLGPPSYPVENMVGRDLAEVQRTVAASGHGWTLQIAEDRRDGTAPDEVLSQDPPPGSELERGGVLHLVRSLGNTLVTVPAMTGRMFEDPAVGAAFTEASLLIRRVDRFDENVPAGQILGVADSGRPVEKYSEVEVVVSSGPLPRTLADYGNPPQDAATARADLVAGGLVVDTLSEASEKVDKGKVIRTEPAAGSQVAKGSTVRLVVSSGPPLVTVPKVYGMTGRAAEDYLIGLGWRVTGIDGPSSGTVISTDPEEGQQRVKGSPIRIITRSN